MDPSRSVSLFTGDPKLGRSRLIYLLEETPLGMRIILEALHVPWCLRHPQRSKQTSSTNCPHHSAMMAVLYYYQGICTARWNTIHIIVVSLLYHFLEYGWKTNECLNDRTKFDIRKTGNSRSLINEAANLKIKSICSSYWDKFNQLIKACPIMR